MENLIHQIKDTGHKTMIHNIIERVKKLTTHNDLVNHYNRDNIISETAKFIRFEEFQNRMNKLIGFQDLVFSRRTDLYTYSNDKSKQIFFVTRNFRCKDLKNLYLNDQLLDHDEWISSIHTLPSICCPRIGLPSGEVNSIKDLLWVLYEDYEIVTPIIKEFEEEPSEVYLVEEIPLNNNQVMFKFSDGSNVTVSEIRDEDTPYFKALDVITETQKVLIKRYSALEVK